MGKWGKGVMRTHRWFDCEPGALAVFMIGICGVALLALSI
jgi:hypothetical protein